MSLKHLFCFGIFFSGFLFSCGKNHDPFASSGATADTSSVNPPAQQIDTSISNGVNLQPSYYNNGNVDFGWALMKQYQKIKTVRIEIEPSVDINTAKAWISQALSNGFHVIATYHKYSVLGSDDASELLKAAQWWKDNYYTLSSAGSFTINIMNEWGSHNLSASAYASAYNNAISVIRQVYSGYLIIDCPGWGQETSTAVQAVSQSTAIKISDSKIILSAHIYPNGWNQAKGHAVQTSDIDELKASGRPCVIGEFGNDPAGSADWADIVRQAKLKGFGVLAWAWNGDGGTMNMVSPQWSKNATASSFSAGSYFNTVYDLL